MGKKYSEDIRNVVRNKFGKWQAHDRSVPRGSCHPRDMEQHSRGEATTFRRFRHVELPQLCKVDRWIHNRSPVIVRTVHGHSASNDCCRSTRDFSPRCKVNRNETVLTSVLAGSIRRAQFARSSLFSMGKSATKCLWNCDVLSIRRETKFDVHDDWRVFWSRCCQVVCSSLGSGIRWVSR